MGEQAEGLLVEMSYMIGGTCSMDSTIYCLSLARCQSVGAEEEKMIENVQIESVPVSDQDQAREFYVSTLGFELLVDNTWREGMRWSEVASQNSTTSLMLVRWHAPRHVPGHRLGR